MDWDENALAAWQAEQGIKDMRRMGKPDKNYRDPRREKLRDYRKPPRRHSYQKENKWVKTVTTRHFRRFLKQNLENEAYYRIRNRDYRTYGWLTW